MRAYRAWSSVFVVAMAGVMTLACQGVGKVPAPNSRVNNVEDATACDDTAQTDTHSAVSEDDGEALALAGARTVDFVDGATRLCRVPFAKIATGWVAGARDTWLGLKGQGCRYDPIIALITACNAAATKGKDPLTCQLVVGSAPANPNPTSPSPSPNPTNPNPTSPGPSNPGTPNTPDPTTPAPNEGSTPASHDPNSGDNGDTTTEVSTSDEGNAQFGNLNSVRGNSAGGSSKSTKCRK